MHRIDGPGATVDNTFTEGDPVGGIQATVVTDDWLNDVQEELMSVLTAGGITPVKGTQDQVLKAIRSLSAGTIGSARNVRMSVATASASATITADQIIVGASLSGQAYRLASLNKTINLSTTGVGGMDTGTAPVSGFVAIYTIYNPTTGVSALLSVNSTSIVAPEVYGGANMQAGYTASALIGVYPTNASGQFLAGLYQKDRDIFFPYTNAVSTSSQIPSLTSVSISAIVPKNARTIKGWVSISASGASNGAVNVAANTAFTGLQQIAVSPTSGGGVFAGNYADVPLITAQTMYWSATVASGTFASAAVNIVAYSF